MSSSLRGLTILTSVELLPYSVKPEEPEMPKDGNEGANVRRYSSREHVRSKYVDDYVTGGRTS